MGQPCKFCLCFFTEKALFDQFNHLLKLFEFIFKSSSYGHLSVDSMVESICIVFGSELISGEKKTNFAEQVSAFIQIGLCGVVLMLNKKPSELDESNCPEIPGTRYRRSHSPATSSSEAGIYVASSSHTSTATTMVVGLVLPVHLLRVSLVMVVHIRGLT
ncbi:hypothetical protein M8C21_019417 [Ambrosia artemisiifolia]|uniref:Uncharacterized protein n=1 Tax=Ambrosia artemisiifolia TaxID=4212 RepID=A0AAD5GHC2_AMBAR|nr:hypothetical protein M8C21_019417 [Ambrosia artemisiifolia]